MSRTGIKLFAAVKSFDSNITISCIKCEKVYAEHGRVQYIKERLLLSLAGCLINDNWALLLGNQLLQSISLNHLFPQMCQQGYLPPVNEVCEGYVFTGVCLSTGRCLSHCMLGYTPPPGTPPGRYSTPWKDTPIPLPSACWDTPPPSCPVHAGMQPSPLAQCMLGYHQQADGTHSTGMHSCFDFFLSFTIFYFV